MLKLIKKYSITLLLLSINTSLYSQITTGDTNVVITTRYRPEIIETDKISILPQLVAPSVSERTYTYHFPSILYHPQSVYTPIDPIFLKPEKAEILFDNYIEVAGGNYLSSFFNANIHNTQHEYNTYGLSLKHHAANQSDNPKNALFSDNYIKAFGLREKGDDVYAEIEYQRNAINYYGYLDKFSDLSLDSIIQIFHDITSKARWNRDNPKYKNQLELELNLFNHQNFNEQTIDIVNSFEKSIQSNLVQLDIEANYTQFYSTSKYNRFTLGFKPHYNFKYKKINLDIGLNTNYLLDSNTNYIYIAPSLRVETDIIPKKIKAYLGGFGNLGQNTFKSVSRENLFIGNNTMYLNPYIWKFYTGMHGSFNKVVQFGFDLKHEIIKDQYFFINDTTVLRSFVTIKDDLNRTTLSGEIKIDLNKKFSFNILGNYYSYALVTQQQAWHMPFHDLSFIAKSHLANKIYFSGSYYITSSREAIDLAGEQNTLKAINDINLAFEYRYKPNIYGFLQVNNILNNRYQLWNNYRAQGLNVLAGISFSL